MRRGSINLATRGFSCAWPRWRECRRAVIGVGAFSVVIRSYRRRSRQRESPHRALAQESSCARQSNHLLYLPPPRDHTRQAVNVEMPGTRRQHPSERARSNSQRNRPAKQTLLSALLVLAQPTRYVRGLHVVCAAATVTDHRGSLDTKSALGSAAVFSEPTNLSASLLAAGWLGRQGRQEGRESCFVGAFAAINTDRVCRSSHHISQASRHPNSLGLAWLR